MRLTNGIVHYSKHRFAYLDLTFFFFPFFVFRYNSFLSLFLLIWALGNLLNRETAIILFFFFFYAKADELRKCEKIFGDTNRFYSDFPKLIIDFMLNQSIYSLCKYLYEFIVRNIFMVVHSDADIRFSHLHSKRPM